MSSQNDDQVSHSGQELPTLIVGGGTMGLLLAHELMVRGKASILLEAGNDKIEPFGSDQYLSTGHKHNGVSIGRTMGLGGTSNLWGGQLAEFVPEDLEPDDKFDQPAWPISWDQLRPYYECVFKKLGFACETPDHRAQLAVQ